MAIETNQKAILVLARNILDDLSKINEVNEEMERALKTLGATFQDDNYNDVCSYVASAQKQLKAAEPEARTVCNKLCEAAGLLIRV